MAVVAPKERIKSRRSTAASSVHADPDGFGSSLMALLLAQHVPADSSIQVQFVKGSSFHNCLCEDTALVGSTQ
jgi:hypothetical protein